MKLAVASRNKNKIREIQAILASLDVEILSEDQLGLDIEVEETGTSFEENARQKAMAVMEATGLPAIADDSGIEVKALSNRPGIFSARYGGDRARNDVERYLLLLDEMKDKTDRRARYVAAICCVFPEGDEITARGECRGQLLYEPKGDGGFGYDPIFLVDGEGITMAELTPERKNQISHRAKALEILQKELEKRNAHK